MELTSKRMKDIGNRDATRLDNGLIRVVVDDKGGMTPELSARRENGYLNAHWVPQFRSNSGRAFSGPVDGKFWESELLYEIAGNFPCLPSFGPPCKVDGASYPTHGTTANGKWKSVDTGVLDGRAAYAIAMLTGDRPRDFSYRKYDFVLAEQPVHYTVLKVKNLKGHAARINAAWHNTIGAPFLEAGALIDASAERFVTPPAPSEFDDTGRLAQGKEFTSIKRVPLRSGKSVNARVVPGMIGYTDFFVGAVPEHADLGWMSVVNPGLSMVYLTFFKGPGVVGDGEIPLLFNDLWMQYGGRRFTPWASSPGGSDATFCLGTENSLGAFANGLAFSLEHPELLGRPTTIELAPGEERVLYYATAVTSYAGSKIAAGVERVQAEKSALALAGQKATGSGTFKIKADPHFAVIEELVATLG